jgi:thiol:disulfide interchange protein
MGSVQTASIFLLARSLATGALGMPTIKFPMREAYKPFWFILAVLGALILMVGISRFTAPREIIPWRTDFASAQKEAAATHKRIFAYFTASWCGPCQNLKSTTWADTNVELALRSFVPVEIDVDANHDLAARFVPEGVIPSFVVMNSDDSVIKSETGALPPDEFLDWLKK